MCERILYTSVWLTGYQEFIAFWILAKVGAGWVYQYRTGLTLVELRRGVQQPRKSENQEEEKQKAIRYNVFMIGNALSIVLGVIGAIITVHWPK